ncbi:MAG: pseudouridine synthase [Vicinamibacteria bacterium]
MMVPTAEPDALSLVRAIWSRGLGSRTQIRRLIETGHVRVKGVIVRLPGYLVQPNRDLIEFQGRSLPEVGPLLYLALHKPAGVVSNRRGRGELTLFDVLPRLPRWVFPVGRLDKETSGLILVTSDGRWSERVAHPDFGVVREYVVELEEPLDDSALQSLRRGIRLGPNLVSQPAHVESVSRELRIRIREGKRHQIRKMVRAAGGRLTSLRRTAIGPIQLDGLRVGELRNLTPQERDSFLSTSVFE